MANLADSAEWATFMELVIRDLPWMVYNAWDPTYGLPERERIQEELPRIMPPLPTYAEAMDWVQRRPDLLVEIAQAEIQGATWLCGRGRANLLNSTSSGVYERGTNSTWVLEELRHWAKSAGAYAGEATWWPPQTDLAQMWLTGCSDMTGDAVLLLQGSGDQLLQASRGLVLATRPDGRQALVTANSMSDQLTPLQAACLLPGAMEAGSYLVL